MPSESAVFKKKMDLTRVTRTTIIIAIAVSGRRDENRRCEISCKEGVPVSQGVYDFVSDSYYVSCASVHHVGTIPFSYEIEVEGIEGWSVIIPLPEVVFKPHLNAEDVQKLDEWKSTIPRRWKIRYIQMLGVF